MRIDEIASAEDQIALFKLITDKVWQALGDQQRAEAETKAAQPLKAKLKFTSPKKPKLLAARPAPKLIPRAAIPAKPKPQPTGIQHFGTLAQNIQSPSTKQKQNAKLDTDSQSLSFGKFDDEQLPSARGKERYS